MSQTLMSALPSLLSLFTVTAAVAALVLRRGSQRIGAKATARTQRNNGISHLERR